MIHKVTLPKLGQTVESATIERWVKHEGDAVAKGDVLCEITTDKATLEVESFFKGTLLKVVKGEGEELPVGALIAVVGDPGDEVPADVASEASAAAAPAVEKKTPARKPPAAKSPAPAPAKRAQSRSTKGAASAAGSKAKVVTLPKLGQTVESAAIEKWHKREGDAVAKGDVLCEITTDKATLEVESFFTGTLLKVLKGEGEELPVGTPIAVIGSPGDAIPGDVDAVAGGATVEGALAAVAAPAAADVPRAAAREGGRVIASPRARRRARELGVALATVTGTGPGGRILEANVMAATEGGGGLTVKATPLARKVAAREGVDLASVTGTGTGGKVTKADVLAGAGAPAVTPGEVVPLTPMRRIVAERMLRSKQTIPCYYLEIDADVTDLVALRNKMNARGGEKTSFSAFILRACGLALRAFPAVNSRWVEGGVERRGEAHVGLAVALDEGLIVPVVRNVDRKDLATVNRESGDLAERARSRRLRPEEYQDGCMTVTNLGMFGIKSFIPVVNPGESTILGLGLIEDRVVSRQGGIHVRKMMTLTLAVDHRLVDGAVGAQFLEMIRDALEAPQGL